LVLDTQVVENPAGRLATFLVTEIPAKRRRAAATETAAVHSKNKSSLLENLVDRFSCPRI